MAVKSAVESTSTVLVEKVKETVVKGGAGASSVLSAGKEL